MIGRFDYDGSRNRWFIVGEDGKEVRELHCGNVLEVRIWYDEDASWFFVRVEMDAHDWWHMIEPDGHQRDDFELLDVRY